MTLILPCSLYLKFYLVIFQLLFPSFMGIFPLLLAQILGRGTQIGPACLFNSSHKLFLANFLIGCLGSDGHPDPTNCILEQEMSMRSRTLSHSDCGATAMMGNSGRSPQSSTLGWGRPPWTPTGAYSTYERSLVNFKQHRRRCTTCRCQAEPASSRIRLEARPLEECLGTE